MVELSNNGCCLGGFMIGLFVVLGCYIFLKIFPGLICWDLQI